MKIYAFEVREDEWAFFDRLSKESGADIELRAEPFRAEDAAWLEAGAGVTTCGLSQLDEEGLAALAEAGVQLLTTRTIGYNHIDLEAAKRYGIHVAHAHYAPDGVADFTVMMLLLCLRGYKQALWRMQVNDYSLGGLMGREIRSLTIGIIGTGRIGTRVLQELSGFGCRLLCWARHPNEEAARYAQYVSLEELYRSCDVISLHLPLAKNTYHMISDAQIDQMKRGVILINCARGGLLDNRALIRGIESEKIGALGLDTVETEEEIMHQDRKTEIFSDPEIAYLKQFKNVVYTQHMAFYTEEAVHSMVCCGVQGILQMAAGEECGDQLC